MIGIEGIGLRKVSAYVEETRADGGEPSKRVVRRAVAAAVIANPWLGTGPRTDLTPVVATIAAPLGMLLSGYLLRLLGSADAVQAFGKGSVVGVDGEIEHGPALLHTTYFGNVLRERLGGTSYINFADVRGVAGTPLVVPMVHKHHDGARDYFESVRLHVPDAPQPGELVIAAVASDGPRPDARIGDRTTDPTVRLADYSGHPLLEAIP